jgi:hypothetical protein
MVLQDEFRALAEAEGPALVSIYLPTARFGPDVAQGPIRLKKLLAEARQRFAEQIEQAERVAEAASGAVLPEHERAEAIGWPSVREFDRRLESVEAHLDDPVYWNHRDEGLAIFVAPDGVHEHSLPVGVGELVVVGSRFDLRPLLPAVSRGRSFYVLALSQKLVRLFEASIAGIRELSLKDAEVPGRLEDAVGWDWSEESLQFRSGPGARARVDGGGGARGGQSAVYHGHGDVGDRKDELRRYLMQVDRGLAAVIEDPKLPMVVAAVDYLLPILGEVSKLGNERVALPGNPDRLSDLELHQAALDVVRPALEAADQALLERLRDTAHTDRTALGLDDVWRSGVEARHSVLFIDPSAECWGGLPNPGLSPELHADRTPHSVDLLDEVWRQAWRVSADIVPVAPGTLPLGEPVAALLRH